MGLHCHTKGCGWGQDDFWSIDGYNPLREDLVNYLRDLLFAPGFISFDKEYADEHPDVEWVRSISGEYLAYGPYIVASELERKAKSIRNMICRNQWEWEHIKNTAVCPECGQKNFDID